MRSLLVLVAVLVLADYAAAQGSGGPCSAMTYENRNQTDYGPIKLTRVNGIAKDAEGVLVPGVCVGVFTPAGDKLIKATQTDGEGRFEIKDIPKGEYRLVARCDGFCTGNAKIRVQPGPGNKKRLNLIIRPAGLDTCSYFELK
jgi:hypothetical protein